MSSTIRRWPGSSGCRACRPSSSSTRARRGPARWAPPTRAASLSGRPAEPSVRRPKSAAVFFALTLPLGASMSCSDRTDSWTGRIEIEDGIRVIHNTTKALASSGAITLAGELIIGREADGRGEGLFRNLLPYGCVDTDTLGRIFVLD